MLSPGVDPSQGPKTEARGVGLDLNNSSRHVGTFFNRVSTPLGSAHMPGSDKMDDAPIAVPPWSQASREAPPWIPEGASQRLHTPRSISFLCSLTAVLMGLGVSLGWAIGSETLMCVLPGHVRMKSNAAVCFVLTGAGLAAVGRLRSDWRWLSDLCAGMVLLCAGATFIEYVLGLNLRIDELLFHDPIQFTYPGRMAPITAVNFCLAASALIAVRRGAPWRGVSQWIGLAIFLLSFAALTGYSYGVPVLYGSAGYTSMALHTGVGFLLLATGFLLAPEDSLLASMLTAPERGGWLIRRFLFAVLLLPPLLGWVYLRPAVSFGSNVFSMALFAVTLAAGGSLALYVLANFFNREERQTAEMDRVREESASAVRQSERELRLITDQLPTLLSYIDMEGRFVRVNQTYELWMGHSAEEIVGKTVRELLGETYWQSTAAAREAVAEGKMVTFEASYPTLQGDRNVQVTYAPDCDYHGHLQGFACLVLDVHERHQAEAALRQSEKLAAVGRLASSIAHEINNPLEAITNLLYLAEQDTGSAYVAQAQNELARVTHIVTQTLRFHRQSTGSTLCCISDLMRQVLVLYQGKLVHGLITVQCRARDSKPLRCRDGEIRQVLANLIGNALDAMQRGGRLFIRAAMAADPQTGACGVRVTIADTGHGISDATRRTLFQPFHSTKGATGSGLGLWISDDIVRRHGGSIKVRSSTRAGRTGTVFRVFLPHLEPASGESVR